jgi:hypothetical protein
MNRFGATFAALALSAAAALLPGCGSSTATVSGEVTYDDQPVGDGGYITFTPADGNGKDVGAPITGGRYQITGVPPGPKVVKVIAVKKVNFASTSEEMKQRAAEARKRGSYDGLVDPADIIPANAEGNDAKVELKPGTQEQNFHLKKPGGTRGN